VFERFTPEARQVVVLAQDEARSLKHDYVGTEHILLGIVRQEDSVSASVLMSFGLTLERARGEVIRVVGPGEEVSPGQIPLTPRAKKVLELSLRESLSLRHDWIGPEHILLGLVREDEGVAARILHDAGADQERIRNEVVRVLAKAGRLPRVEAHPIGATYESRWPVDAAWLETLAPALDALAQDIRRELGRAPDVGDLLLVLACAPEFVAGRALHELGIDIDALWGTIERIRQASAAELKELERHAEEVRQAKQDAIEKKRFDEAARLRDQERELTEGQRSRRALGPDVRAEIRRRLGLPKHSE
jgi:ATP-dependent Clp protease ATP-binding subunit ClpA